MTTLPANFALPSADGYAAYIRAVEAIPPITESEEKKLVAAYRDNNDVAAARRLAMAHLRLVITVARGYNGYGLEQSDLVQEGNIGLLKAVQKFEPTHGARLATFAVYWIRAEIYNFILRNWRIVKIATTKAQRKLFFNKRKLFEKNANGDLHSAETIATDLGVQVEDVNEMRDRVQSTNTIALSVEKDGEEIGSDTILAASAEDADPELLLIAKKSDESEKTDIYAALESLDDRGRCIIHSRHLQEKPAPLRELADKFDISVERVRQLEVQALQRLRRHMQAA
ncbi:MAG: RNA polymerase factor sigma-32 [Gammaproteobacteria bacterium WSBS_2016_MAG_OTU1]